MTQSLLDGFCVKSEKQEPACDKSNMGESDSDTEEKLVIDESDAEKTTTVNAKSRKDSKSTGKNDSSPVKSHLNTPSSTKKRKKVVDLFGDSSDDEFETKKFKQSKSKQVEKDKEQNDKSSSTILVSSEITILKNDENCIPKVKTVGTLEVNKESELTSEIKVLNKTSTENNTPKISSKSSGPSNKVMEINNKPTIAPEASGTSNKAKDINNKPKIPPEPTNCKTNAIVNKDPKKDLDNSSKVKVKVDIAGFVVKQMTPYYKKGMIASRELFKATARHIVHHLLAVNKTGRWIFNSFTLQID